MKEIKFFLNDVFFDDIKYAAGVMYHRRELSKFLSAENNAIQKLANQIVIIFKEKDSKRADIVAEFFEKRLSTENYKKLCQEINEHQEIDKAKEAVRKNLHKKHGSSAAALLSMV